MERKIPSEKTDVKNVTPGENAIWDIRTMAVPTRLLLVVSRLFKDFSVRFFYNEKNV